MFAVTVRFDLKPGRAVPFLDLIGKKPAQSLADARGCSRFDVCASDDLPGGNLLYEVHDDATDFDSHKSMPHHRAFNEAAAPPIEKKRVATYRLAQAPE